MIIAGMYSFNQGWEVLQSGFPLELEEVQGIIARVDCTSYKTKSSHEKTMPGKILYSPRGLNKAFREEFEKLGWRKYKVECEYSTSYYINGYMPRGGSRGAFREMDFVKSRIGVEVQFGKYAFMVYNVCAKMTIFHRLGVIDAGIEIVPVKQFADEMSTGVSYFEQFIWDLEHRGVADIDVPVLVVGVSD